MDVIEHHHRATESTAAVLAKVGEDRLNVPTPCRHWTIAGIVDHLVGNNRAMLGRIGKESIVDELGPDFLATSKAFLAAYDDPEVLNRKFELAGFELDGRGLVAVNFADVLVHGWDIARAAGLDIGIDEDLCAAAFRITERFPESLRGPDGAFDHPRPVADEAPPQTRLIAFLGRDPEWTAESTSNR